MPVVRLRAPLSELAGGKRELELDGSTVGEVLQALEREHPDVKGWILDERGSDPRAHQRLREQGLRTGGHDSRRSRTGCTCSPRSREDEMTQLLVGTKKGLFVLEGEAAAPFEVTSRAFAGEPVEFATRDPRTGTDVRMRDLRLLRAEDLLHRRPRRRVGAGGRASSCPRTRRCRWSGSGRSCRRRTTVSSTRAARRVCSSRATTEARPGSSTRRSGSSRRGPTGAPARAACACTRSRPGREIRPASHSRSRRSASGSPTTAAQTWRHGNKGMYPRYMPEEAREDTITLCVHNMHRAPKRPERLFMQFHGGVYRSDDAGESWTSHRGRPPVRLRLPDGDGPGRPGQRLRHPARRGLDRTTPEGRVRVYETRDAGETWIDTRRRPAVERRLPHDPPPGVLPRGIRAGDGALLRCDVGRRLRVGRRGEVVVHGGDEPPAGALGARGLGLEAARLDPGRGDATETRVSPSRCDAYFSLPCTSARGGRSGRSRLPRRGSSTR